MIRILIILGLFGLLNIYAAARIIYRWPWAELHIAGAWFIVAILFFLQLLGLFGDHNILPKLKKDYNATLLVFLLDWVSYLTFGLMSLLVVYGLMIDAVYILCQLLVPSFNPFDFDVYALWALGAATAATLAAGIFRGVTGAHVCNVTIPLKNLPPAFDGFTIAQVSDLHIGPVLGRHYAERVVATVNALKPDLIALTGDFIDGTVENLTNDVAPLSQLQAPKGTFFITGNHEYYWDAPAWIEKFRHLGARVLLNEHVLIKQGDSALVLAGVTDYAAASIIPSHASDPFKAAKNAPQGLIRILLAHQPASYKKAEEAGFDLQLSGHTHAGQYFPFTFLIRFFQRYYKGLNRYKNMWVYVNRGTGYWGPPLRTGAPSEITFITLRPEA